MFCHVDDLNRVNGLVITSEGLVVADPNEPGFFDAPIENLHSSAPAELPTRHLDLEHVDPSCSRIIGPGSELIGKGNPEAYDYDPPADEVDPVDRFAWSECEETPLTVAELMARSEALVSNVDCDDDSEDDGEIGDEYDDLHRLEIVLPPKHAGRVIQLSGSRRLVRDNRRRPPQ